MYNEYHHIDKPCRAIVLAFLDFKYQDYTLLPVNLRYPELNPTHVLGI